MELLKAYIKARQRVLTALILFAAIFLISFALYRLPLAAVLYPGMLCLLLGILYFVLDYTRVRNKHRRLMKIKGLNDIMISPLPEKESIEEGDYQAIVEALKGEVLRLEALAAAREKDMTDYYTVWVHQIKTPMASMQLALQNEDTPISRRLSSQLMHIEQYVEMALAFLRLDSDSSDYVFREHSIDAIVRQSVAKFASEFIDRKLSLHYETIEGTVITDEKWLSFVVEQLLSNALKYTREGGITITMQKPKTLCIADSGIGIAPEDLPRIFEKGYTGYNGRRDKKASGLGLYLCQRICNNLGIEIDISSQLDKGTTVRIHLEQYQLKKE